MAVNYLQIRRDYRRCKRQIAESPLALHNTHNLEGIILAEELFPAARQIAVLIPLSLKRYRQRQAIPF
jgi:hypothetical protein